LFITDVARARSLLPLWLGPGVRQRQQAARTPNASRGSARNLAQSARFSGIGLQCYVGKASSCTVPGLTSGTQYWFQVSAIRAAGPGAWSDPATKRAT